MSDKRFIDGAWREVYTIQIDQDLAHELSDIFFLCGETEERAGELARALLTHIGDHDLEIVRMSDDGGSHRITLPAGEDQTIPKSPSGA